MKDENLLTEGGVLGVLLRFSVPFLIANIIQALYGAVDLMVIGRYCSSESVAAVSTGTRVTPDHHQHDIRADAGRGSSGGEIYRHA